MVLSRQNVSAAKLIPENEKLRLEALERYEILDTPSEEIFNNIVKVACRIFNVPIALVSLVASDRVFFKANMGMPGVKNAGRDTSLCSLAILTDDVTVFENAQKEKCLLANPLVTGSFGLKFYAGAPLKTSDGFNIGALCIVDKKPRTFTEADRESLNNLATLVMDEIELRRTSINLLKEKQKLLDISLNNNQELIKKNSNLDNFVYAVSHDLKAPVTSIEGLVNILSSIVKEEDISRTEVNKVIDLIYKSIKKFKITIKDLAEIGRFQATPKNHSDLVSIHEVIEDVRIFLAEEINHSKANISFDLQVDHLKIIRINLQTILLNLVSNAIKYRASDRVVNIKIKSEKIGSDIRITVQDNGIGIQPKFFENLFDMFSRFNDQAEGSGIGLYLVKRIVDQENGTIEVSSSIGEGTTFIVKIPSVL